MARHEVTSHDVARFKNCSLRQHWFPPTPAPQNTLTDENYVFVVGRPCTAPKSI